MNFNTKLSLILENQRSIIMTSAWSDGVVSFVIDGKKYEYYVPTMHHPKLWRMANRSGASALNEIKKLIRSNVAKSLNKN